MTRKGENRKKTASQSCYVDQIQEAADYGIDVNMLLDNIERSPAERIRRHQIALNTAEKLRKTKQI